MCTAQTSTSRPAPPAWHLVGQWSCCSTRSQECAVSAALMGLVVPFPSNQYRLMFPLSLQCERKLKQKRNLPPKYTLELVTIYAWEHSSGTVNFNTAEGFRTVLELITKYQQLCIFWTVNDNLEDETMRNFPLTQIQRTRCLPPSPSFSPSASLQQNSSNPASLCWGHDSLFFM